MLPEPATPDLVQKYIDKYNQSDRYRNADLALNKVFSIFPRNVNIEEILIKVTVLNSLYSTNIFSPYAVAQHIFDLNIDDRLGLRSKDLVNGIAKVIIKGKLWNFYSFATKYCSWHRPNDYPIYDHNVDNLLWKYKSRYFFDKFYRYELLRYEKFCDFIDSFCHFFHLEQFCLRDIDKFLWGYGKDLK